MLSERLKFDPWLLRQIRHPEEGENKELTPMVESDGFAINLAACRRRLVLAIAQAATG